MSPYQDPPDNTPKIRFTVEMPYLSPDNSEKFVRGLSDANLEDERSLHFMLAAHYVTDDVTRDLLWRAFDLVCREQHRRADERAAEEDTNEEDEDASPVAQTVADWESARITAIPSGEHNDTFLIWIPVNPDEPNGPSLPAISFSRAGVDRLQAAFDEMDRTTPSGRDATD